MPPEELVFSDPETYSENQPIHTVVYARNGVGKTTFAGGPAKEKAMRTVILDCSDSGAVTLRNHPKEFLRIIRIRSIMHYLDVIDQLVSEADSIDLLVPDTLTGLQSLALREVKGRKNFEMNQRKWGLVAARIIECIAETRNFPKDVLYLLQEKKSGGGEDEADEVMSAIQPSTKSYLSSCVDWVGHLTIEESADKDGKAVMSRFLDFRITEFMEAKDRAGLFPKRLKNPTYMAMRNKIITQLKTKQGEESNG